MSDDKKIKVVIPAAGNGTRFGPLTKYIPKEVLPIKFYKEEREYHKKYNGTPILQANILNLEKIAEKFIIVTNEMKENSLESCLCSLLMKYDIKVPFHFVKQESPLGDGDAIYQVMKELCGEYNNPNLFIHYGDLVYNSPKAEEDFKEAVSLYFKEKEKDENLVALFLTYSIEEDPSRFGVLSLEGYDNKLYKVKNIVEKPKDEETQEKLKVNGKWYINSGILIINTKKLKPYFIREYEKIGENKEIVLANIISNALKDGKKALAYPIQGEIEDLGTFDDWILHHYKHIKR